MEGTVKKLSAEEVKSLEDQVSVPYKVEDVTVLSPGEWKGIKWTASELKEAVENTNFKLSRNRGDERPPNSSIYYDHNDRSADNWVGNVENVRMAGNGDVKTDLVITDKQLAMNLEYGAPFGISPKADGLVDGNQKMQQFQFQNFSMVVNPAVKTTWLNEDIETVLQDMEVHSVSFNSTTSGDWDSPNLEDFTDESWNDLSQSKKRAIGRHFLISKTGFPPENYTDFALPVVEPNGNLNLNALRNAKARASQVSGIEDEQITRVQKMINNLANGNFEEADFEDVDMSGHMEEMQDYTVHRPEWGSTTESDWSEPALEDFTDESWEDLSDDEKTSIGEHYIVSSTGFPSENFGDMSLPVVQPDGSLNLNALANSKARAGQVEGLSEENVLKVKKMVTEIANDNFEDADFEKVENGEDTENNNLNKDTMVKTDMAEEQEVEQEPETEESPEEESAEEETVENSEDYVTADRLEDFKSEVVNELKQELEDDEDDGEEAEDEEVEEAEASDEELSDFEEFRTENPELSLSEAAERFEEETKSADEKIEEVAQKFENKISDLEDKLEDKEEEVEELSEKVENPQRATQASDDGEEEDVREKVSELSDEELHAQIFKQMQDKTGARVGKELVE